jgi:hypothetical protein
MSRKQRNLKEFRRRQRNHLLGTAATIGLVALATYFNPGLTHLAEKAYELLGLVALEILFLVGLD